MLTEEQILALHMASAALVGAGHHDEASTINSMLAASAPTPSAPTYCETHCKTICQNSVHGYCRGAPTAPAQGEHPDDIAVDSFARAMKAKMADARAKGRSGWEGMNPGELSHMLRAHVEKGDPRDVANFCMMLWHHNAAIRPPAQGEPVAQWQYCFHDGAKWSNWDNCRDLLVKHKAACSDFKFRALYERVAPAVAKEGMTEEQQLRDALRDCVERMERARHILTNGEPRPECNWGMLDTGKARALLGAKGK